MLRDKIGTPQTVLLVPTPAAYETWARRVRLDLHLPAALTRSETPIAAHVSDGRWVIDCPCGGGALAEPAWGIGICVDCGTIHPVTFPRERAAIEEVLLARPSEVNRHFLPAEAHRHRLTVRAARRGMSLETELFSRHRRAARS